MSIIGELKRGVWLSHKDMVIKVTAYDSKNIRGIDYAHDDDGIFRKVVIPANAEASIMTQMDVLEWLHKRVESVSDQHRNAAQEVVRLSLIKKKYLMLKI